MCCDMAISSSASFSDSDNGLHPVGDGRCLTCRLLSLGMIEMDTDSAEIKRVFVVLYNIVV